MGNTDETIRRDDPFDLGRFTSAQERVYSTVLAELQGGWKRSHWMWYVFPQIAGLGHTSTSIFYSIKNIEEAREYLRHPVLGPRLTECAETLLALQGRSASQIFGFPDDMKLKSSMTLFAAATEDPGSVFVRVLEKYFHGERDARTLDLLKISRKSD